jgi:peptidyl-prolyl cis-trans isomerase SurA
VYLLHPVGTGYEGSLVPFERILPARQEGSAPAMKLVLENSFDRSGADRPGGISSISNGLEGVGWKNLAPRALLLATLAMVTATAGCQQKPVQPAEGVWALVNGKEITRADVDKYYRSQLNPDAREPSQDEALSLKLNILDELVNNQILLQRANKLGLLATDGEVEDKFTEFKSPYTEDELQRQLKVRAYTVEDLKADLRQQLSIQKLINREVLSKIAITDQDLQDFYNQNRAQFNVAEPQYRLAQIVVTPRKDPQIRNRKNDDATTDAEARRKAAALEAQINTGSDFATLAMDYSEDPASSGSGGDLGYVPESSLSQSDPALKKAVLALKPGEVSGVIVLRDSYRILKLVAKEAPGQRELSDPAVQQSIRDNLHNRKEQLLRAAYLASARDDSKIVNYLAQQVMESSGKLPVVVPAKPAAPVPAPAAAAPSPAPEEPQAK